MCVGVCACDKRIEDAQIREILFGFSVARACGCVCVQEISRAFVVFMCGTIFNSDKEGVNNNTCLFGETKGKQ